MKNKKKKYTTIAVVCLIVAGLFGSIFGLVGFSSINKVRNQLILTMTNQAALENASENIQTLRNLLLDCLFNEKEPDADMEAAAVHAKAEYEVEIVKLQELASEEEEEKYAAMETDYFMFVSTYNEIMSLCGERNFEDAGNLFLEEAEPIAKSLEEQLTAFAEENTPQVEHAGKKLDNTVKVVVRVQIVLLIFWFLALICSIVLKRKK